MTCRVKDAKLNKDIRGDPMCYSIKYQEGLVYVSIPYLTELGFVNAFTTRVGGISQRLYDGLNLGLHTGDDPEAVIENRMRVARVLKSPLSSFVAGEQVHGNRVAIVTEVDKGKGATALETALPKTDAMITEVPGLFLMGFFADCVPVLLVDPISNGMGLVHAGWRGTASGITKKCIEEMVKNFNTDPSSYIAVIGPSIGPCCYYVQENVAKEVEKSVPTIKDRIFYEDKGGYYLDLWGANRAQLIGAGLIREKIFTTCVCTCCMSQLFFSYRATQGQTGRIGAFIGRVQCE